MLWSPYLHSCRRCTYIHFTMHTHLHYLHTYYGTKKHNNYMCINIYIHICIHLNIYTPATHCLYNCCRTANAKGVTIQFHVIRAQQKMSILYIYIYIHTHPKFKIEPENAGFQNKISFSRDLFWASMLNFRGVSTVDSDVKALVGFPS